MSGVKDEATRRAVDALQRELLGILNRHARQAAAHYSADTITGILGARSIEPPHGCAEIRARILELDPNACIYAVLGGELPADWCKADYRPASHWVKMRRRSDPNA